MADDYHQVRALVPECDHDKIDLAISTTFNHFGGIITIHDIRKTAYTLLSAGCPASDLLHGLLGIGSVFPLYLKDVAQLGADAVSTVVNAFQTDWAYAQRIAEDIAVLAYRDVRPRGLQQTVKLINEKAPKAASIPNASVEGFFTVLSML